MLAIDKRKGAFLYRQVIDLISENIDSGTLMPGDRLPSLRRMSEPDELGRLAVFLASELARCITGQLILADAGAFLSRNRPAHTEASAPA